MLKRGEGKEKEEKVRRKVRRELEGKEGLGRREAGRWDRQMMDRNGILLI